MELRLENSISIYDYIEFRRFLIDLLSVYKKENKNVTISSLARKSQQISKAYLSLVINGKRNLSAKRAEELGSVLGLRQKELVYFECLVRLNQSKSLNEKIQMIDQISALRPKQKRQNLKFDQYSNLVNWNVLVLKELIQFEDFNEDPKWISQKLKRYMSESESKTALQKLQACGIVFRNEKGRLVTTAAPLQTSDELKSLAIQRYHISCLDLSKKVLANSDVQDREFTSVNKLLTESQFKYVKEKIKRLRDEVLEMCDENQSEPRAIYQLNIQLLNLSSFEEKLS